jgi:hypothetical protein
MRRIGPWGDARLRVAQFLANLWQGPRRSALGHLLGQLVYASAVVFRQAARMLSRAGWSP